MPTPDLASIVERVRSSVVRVSTISSAGSGVIVEVESNGSAVVVTNHHVIDDGGAVDVLVNDSDRYSATVLGFDASKDLAVLRICCSAGFRASPLSSGTELADGSTVFTMGYPLGRWAVTDGIVSGLNFDQEAGRWEIHTNASINSGNSGGPLFTMDGEVVGINTYVIRQWRSGAPVEGFGFAIWARTVLESLPAMMAGSKLGVTPEPTPRPSPTPGAGFGPVDGSIEHKDDGSIDTYSARVSVSDFSAVATFENPYARSVGGWDYGFLFRHPAHNTFHVVFVTDDRRWFHYVRNSSVESQRLADSGSVSALQTNAGASNELRVIAAGDSSWFLVNGELVARLDLTGGPAAGDVVAITGSFNDNVVAGYSTRFRGFAVREPRHVGDESGQLQHDADGFINQFNIGADVSDFVAAATFTNPYSSRTGTWDYGIGFRDDPGAQNTFHAVTIQSTGQWEYYVREGSDMPTHRESGSARLNLGQGAENQLHVIAVGDTVLLHINGAFIKALDISRGSGNGDVWAGTGFYAGNEIPGHSTGYDFQVWSLD